MSTKLFRTECREDVIEIIRRAIVVTREQISQFTTADAALAILWHNLNLEVIRTNEVDRDA